MHGRMQRADAAIERERRTVADLKAQLAQGQATVEKAREERQYQSALKVGWGGCMDLEGTLYLTQAAAGPSFVSVVSVRV